MVAVSAVLAVPLMQDRRFCHWQAMGKVEEAEKDFTDAINVSGGSKEAFECR